MSENTSAEDVERKINLLTLLGDLYDGASELAEKAFEAAAAANTGAKQQEEIFREVARKGSAALDSLKRAGAILAEALLAAKSKVEKPEASDD